MMLTILFAAAVAQGASGEDRAYLECYRGVTAAGQFAAMTAAQLDQNRMEIAEAVIGRCEGQMRRQRRQAEERVREASRVGRQMGDSALPPGMAQALGDMALTGIVAGDLDRAEPRMQGLVDARLQERVAEALRIEADAAGEAADTVRLTGGPRISGPDANEFYRRCLTRLMVREARTDRAEDRIFDAARNACATARRTLVEQNGPMLDAMLNTDEELLREDAPALVRALRARRGGGAG